MEDAHVGRDKWLPVVKKPKPVSENGGGVVRRRSQSRKFPRAASAELKSLAAPTIAIRQSVVSSILSTNKHMSNAGGCCEHCNAIFTYRLLHNGFNDSAYGYCDKCSFSVLLHGWSPVAQRLSLHIQQRITPDMEVFLKPCPCGGRFSACADPRCPACAGVLSATKAGSYIERNAPGTVKGWRWQRSWSGVYSIVLSDNVVEDWWNDQAVGRM